MNNHDHSPQNASKPFLGFGLGLRSAYYETILKEQPDVDWFEVLTENYLIPGGKPLYYLKKISEQFPVVLHGVSLSIGSTDPLNHIYLQQLKKLIATVKPKWVSDHLCWTGVEGKNTHDLLPLPQTEEAIHHVAKRIREVQEFLGQTILIENISSYLNMNHEGLTEWEFLTAVAEEADCHILLDINNIYVNSKNHSFNPYHYLAHLPPHRIQQIHLAGHSQEAKWLIDTHDQPIISPVWQLYEIALARFGAISTLIERDDRFPPFAELLAELNEARRIFKKVLHEK